MTPGPGHPRSREIRFCRSFDGVRLAYATFGSGPPLVWVASWLTHVELDQASPVWSHWIEELSRGHTLVRYDARGTGLSDRSVGDLTVEAWSRDLAAVVEAVSDGPVDLLGFCQGGPPAIAYAVEHPERVRRLVLYDSYAVGPLAERSASEEARYAEVLADMIEVGWGEDAGAFRKVFGNLLVPGASRQQEGWFAELQRRSADPATAVRIWRAINSLDVRDLTGDVDVETLVFHVRGDPMVPFEEGRRLASSIPGARFHPLEGENHVLLEEDAAWPRFLSELRSFLDTRIDAGELGEIRRSLSGLTPRERDVLEHLATGLDNAEIADRLGITAKTVRNHLSRVYGKLGVEGRSRAIVLARKAGLGEGI